MNELDKILDSLPGDSMVFFEAREDFKQAIEAYIAEQTRLARIDELKKIAEAQARWVTRKYINGRLDHLSKKGEDNGHK